MQQHVFEGVCRNTVCIFSIYIGLMFHKISSHLVLTPHKKCCAETSSFTTGRQLPWCCIALCRCISLDIEATHLESALQVLLAQPCSATQLYCFQYLPAPCRSSSSASALFASALLFRLPHLVIEAVVAITLSSVTVMLSVV